MTATNEDKVTAEVKPKIGKIRKATAGSMMTNDFFPVNAQ
jgi:hypothetical protein